MVLLSCIPYEIHKILKAFLLFNITGIMFLLLSGSLIEVSSLHLYFILIFLQLILSNTNAAATFIWEIKKAQLHNSVNTWRTVTRLAMRLSQFRFRQIILSNKFPICSSAVRVLLVCLLKYLLAEGLWRFFLHQGSQSEKTELELSDVSRCSLLVPPLRCN